jgi:hypothetical protein
MTKQGFVTAIFCAGAAIGLTTPAQADILPAPIPSYDGIGYDFTTPQTTPPAYTTIGTFSFAIPVGGPVTGIMVSGSFGNDDSPTTALAALANVAAQLAKGTLDLAVTMDQPSFTQTGLNWTVYAGQTTMDTRTLHFIQRTCRNRRSAALR